MSQFFYFMATQPANDITFLPFVQQIPIITASCLFVLFVASRTIKCPHTGPKMPLGPFAPLFNNISLAGFLASMSFGHVLGVLLVIGLSPYIQ